MGSSFKAPNVTAENDGEKEFRWYCEELKKYGWLKDFTREPETFKVLDPFVALREVHHKSKDNTIQNFNLLRPVNYTYDFRLVWNPIALYIFTEIYQEGEAFRFGKPPFISHRLELFGRMEIVTYVDVKPHSSATQRGARTSSSYSFPFIQKMLMHLHGLYINKIIPSPDNKKDGVNTCLFATTFTPNRYLFTEGGGSMRKLHHMPIKIESFTKKKGAIIQKMLADIENKNLKNNQNQLF